MLGIDRRREVSDFVRLRGTASVNELAEALGVSVQTVRRDLQSLEEDGLLERVHGGAVWLAGADQEVDSAHRSRMQADAKRRIGEAAAALVAPGSTIFVSGGTTTEAMVPFLEPVKGLTIVTNAINVAYALARQPATEVIVLSGYLRHSELTLLGGRVAEALADFHVEHAIYGCFGLDPEAGITGASLAEASTDRAIIDAVGSLTVLADHTKFAQRGPVRLAPAASISTLVTDDEAPAAGLEQLRGHGVKVVQT